MRNILKMTSSSFIDWKLVKVPNLIKNTWLFISVVVKITFITFEPESIGVGVYLTYLNLQSISTQVAD